MLQICLSVSHTAASKYRSCSSSRASFSPSNGTYSSCEFLPMHIRILAMKAKSLHIDKTIPGTGRRSLSSSSICGKGLMRPRLTQALMWANGLYYAVAFFINIFACRPRKKIWNPEMPGNCFDVTSLYISSAVFNTFSDVAMLAVPIIMVWKLQMSTKRKLGISAIFGTGGFATICAVTRIYFQMKLIHSKDFTFVHMQTGLLGLVTAFSRVSNI